MNENTNRTPVTKGMILAGGLGTRFLPATLAVAKELVTVGNKPILMYHLADLKKAGVTDVLIVGNKLKEDSFRNFLNPPVEYLEKVEADGKMSYLEEFYDIMQNMSITYVNQDDEAFVFNGQVYQNEYAGNRGSAIAIGAGKYWANGEPFICLNGDDLCFYEDGKSMSKEVIDVYNATGDNVVYGERLPRELVYKYSAMVFGEPIKGIKKAAKMLDIVEKPPKGTEPSTVMGFGRYILTSDFFDRIFKVKQRGNGEYNMTDVLQSLAQSGLCSTIEFDGTYFDCGSIAGYSCANAYIGLNNKESAEFVKQTLLDMLGDYYLKEK